MKEQDHKKPVDGYALGEELNQIAYDLAKEKKLWEPSEPIPDWLRNRMPNDEDMEEKLKAVFGDVPPENRPDEWNLLAYINKTRMFWYKQWKAGYIREDEWIKPEQ